MIGGGLTTALVYVGLSGTGSVVQSGGTIAASGFVDLGQNVSASGSFNLGSGLLTMNGSACLGYAGTGTFTQTGGTNLIGFGIHLGQNTGASGSYNLVNGQLIVSGSESVGYGSTSANIFMQSGGTNSISKVLVLGNLANSSGSYSLIGGLLTATSGEYIGNSGTGSLTQGGGTNSVSGALVLGQSTAASGNYNLNGGTLVVNQISGGMGTSTFTFNGGLLQASVSANGSFFGGLTNAYIQSGGATIDTNGKSLTVTQALLDGGGGGGLTKNGIGALTLAGSNPNTYTGSTNLTRGSLKIESPLSGPGGPVTIQTPAMLVATASIQRAIAGAAGCQIIATSGNISLGDSTSATGFNQAGTLMVDSNTVTLNSLGSVDLGSSTSLNGGTIVAPNGIFLNQPFDLAASRRA